MFPRYEGKILTDFPQILNALFIRTLERSQIQLIIKKKCGTPVSLLIGYKDRYPPQNEYSHIKASDS